MYREPEKDCNGKQEYDLLINPEPFAQKIPKKKDKQNVYPLYLRIGNHYACSSLDSSSAGASGVSSAGVSSTSATAGVSSTTSATGVSTTSAAGVSTTSSTTGAGAASTTGASTFSGAAVEVALAFPPRRLFAFFSSFLPPLYSSLKSTNSIIAISALSPRRLPILMIR